MQNWKKFPRVFLFTMLILGLCAGLVVPRLDVAEAAPKALNATGVVISEFRTRGPSVANAATDEFIEIYNPTNLTITIEGLKLRKSSACGNAFSDIYIFPTGTKLLPGQYYLVASLNYSGGVIPDVTLPTNMSISDTGGIAITDAFNTPVDQVGMCAGTAYREGIQLPDITTTTGQSYERYLGGPSDSCQDNNDNFSDFQPINPSKPQNLLSTRSLCGVKVNLSLTMTVDNPTQIVGGNVTFTITVSNINNAAYSTATNVTVKDLLPAGLTYQSNNPSMGTYNNVSGIWTVGTLPINTNATLTLVAKVAASSSRTNVAEVWTADQVDANSTPGDGTGIDDYASISITLPPADLSLTKTVNNPTPNVGDTVIFTITASNAGPNAATNVIVNDVLSSANFDNISDDSGGAYTSASGDWVIPAIAVGAVNKKTLNITARIISGLPATNSAQIISADQSDPNIVNNSASASVTPNKIAGMTITNTVNNLTPNVGDNVVFTIKVSNTSATLNATGVNVAALLPPSGLSFVSSSSGSYTSASGNWAIGNLAAGANATLFITAKVIASGQIDYLAVVSSDQFIDQPKTETINPALNTNSNLSLLPQEIIKSNTAGDVDLKITILNSGPDAASNVQVKDLLPSGLSYVSHSTTIGTYDKTTGIWSISSLSTGASGESLTITVKVSSTGSSTKNFAEVWQSDQFDTSTPGNGPQSPSEDDETSLEVPIADLSLSETVDISGTSASGTAIFTITVKNSGPDAVTDVNVKTDLPSKSVYSFVSSSGGYTSTTGTWNVGALADGATATLTITTFTSGPPVTVWSEVSSSSAVDPDSVPNNNSRTEDDDEGSPYADLSLAMAVDNSKPNAGSNVIFTLTLSNAGTKDATGIKVKDLLPTGLKFITAVPQVGTYDDTTGIWNVGALAQGSTNAKTLKITANVVTSGNVTNAAEIYAADMADPDSLPNNDVTTEDDYAQIVIQPISSSMTIIISEVAWAGTSASSSDEWIELYNPGSNPINITGWKLKDNTTTIVLSGSIPAGGFFLLENREQSVNDVLSDQISGSLSLLNAGEILKLFDSSDKQIDSANSNGGTWPAGSSTTYGTMERVFTVSDSDTAWITNNGKKRNGHDALGNNIWGTPKFSSPPTPIPTPATATATPVAPKALLINEVAWAGTAASSSDEWIEIHNPGTNPINLSGWQLEIKNITTGAVNLIPLNNYKLAADGYYVIAPSSTIFQESGIVDQESSLGGLNDGGERIWLKDINGINVDSANSDNGTWPAGNANSKASMERYKKTSDYPDSRFAWLTYASAQNQVHDKNGNVIKGTPGYANWSDSGVVITPTATRVPPRVQNTAIPLEGRLVINEFLPRPGYDWNKDGKVDVYDEFIEVKNIGNEGISLNGWSIDDAANSGSAPFKLPSIALKPGERVVYFGLQTNILLSDGGDTVRLFNINGREYDKYIYSVAKDEDISICRMPDGNGSWYQDCTPTPNLINTREGVTPSMPGNNFTSPVCSLPDTLPVDFLFAECRGYGTGIWSSMFWDATGWQGDRIIPDDGSKWKSFVE